MSHRTIRTAALFALALFPRTPLEAREVPTKLEPVIAEASARLLALQENLDDPEGTPREWPYEGVYRTGGQIPPGYRVGGTAIAAWALIEAPDYASDERRVAAVGRGLDFVLDQLDENKRLGPGFRGGYDVRGWGQAYALQFLLRLRAKELVPEAERERVARTIPRLIELLEESAIPETGGWNYARSGGAGVPTGASPFMTAPTLLALLEARAQGETIDEDVVALALDSLERGLGEGTIVTYNTARQGGDTPAGSVGRRPVSELALIAAGRAKPERLEPALDAFLEHWGELETRRRKTGTHEPPHGIAPYYFFYAHFYAALAIEGLPPAKRPAYRTKFLERLFEVREASGGWNDRVFERSENFGTAMSLLALVAPRLGGEIAESVPVPASAPGDGER